VVKEHWISAPVRSDDFYKSLSLDFPNVIFIKANIPGIEIIKKSLGVATINGTSGLEAALMGKPVISFSKHNYYNFLDHVHVVKSDKDIHTFLKKILNKSFDNIKAKKDGAKLAKAIELSSVKLPDFSYSNSNIKENDLKLCFTRLLNTLR
jgi:predicted glycosyltransferase